MCASGILWSFESQDARSALQAKPEYREVLRKHVGWAIDDHAATVVFTELVGNVMKHAPGRIQISLECDGADVFLSVKDSGPGFDFTGPSALDMRRESGRGLFIVSKYARTLQVAPHDGHGSSVIAALRSIGAQSSLN